MVGVRTLLLSLTFAVRCPPLKYRETHRQPYLGTDVVYFAKPLRAGDSPQPRPAREPVTIW